MQTHNLPPKSPITLAIEHARAAGESMGEARGEAKSLLTILEARGWGRRCCRLVAQVGWRAGTSSTDSGGREAMERGARYHGDPPG